MLHQAFSSIQPSLTGVASIIAYYKSTSSNRYKSIMFNHCVPLSSITFRISSSTIIAPSSSMKTQPPSTIMKCEMNYSSPAINSPAGVPLKHHEKHPAMTREFRPMSLAPAVPRNSGDHGVFLDLHLLHGAAGKRLHSGS